MASSLSTKIGALLPFAIGAAIAAIAQHKGIISPPYLSGMWTGIWDITSQTPLLSFLPIPTQTPLAAYIYPTIAGIAAAFITRSTSAQSIKDGVTCVLGSLKWDRNAFCRGWLITGGTGCGKTAVAICILVHQVFRNEAGQFREAWKGSKAEKSLAKLRKHLDEQNKSLNVEIEAEQQKVDDLKAQFDLAVDKEFAARIALQLDSVDEIETDNPRANRIRRQIEVLKETIRITKMALKREGLDMDIRQAYASPGAPSDQDKRINELSAERDRILDELNDSNVIPQEASDIPEMEQDLSDLRSLLQKAALPVDAARIQTEIDATNESINRKICERVANTQSYASQYDRVRDLIYERYPWGGICVDEKGLYYQTFTKIATYYQRDQDLCLLQTRPDWAPADWKPPATYNLLSDYDIPSNTYANAIVETANSVTSGDGDKGFFRTQAESNIGWAIELYRSIRRAQLNTGRIAEDECVFPTLKNVLEILTDKNSYDKLISRTGAKPPDKAQQVGQMSDDDGNKIDMPMYYGENHELIVVLHDEKLTECLAHFENRYWSQPPDQLGGVQGTVYNYLAYFAADDIAEVFCTGNTFELADIAKGKIICIAMPQKLQIERRYVGTILKVLFYKQVLRRFDLPEREFEKNNLVIAWQDEAQRFVIEEDGNVDVTREASGTTVLATQQQPALWVALGDEKKAKVTIGNLRNRFIFRAATHDCAEASADFLGKETKEKISKTVSKDVSKSFSEEDSHKIKPHHLQKLKDFTAYIVHADGMVEKYLIKAKTADYRDVSWWGAALLQRKMWLPWIRCKLGLLPDFLKMKIR